MANGKQSTAQDAARKTLTIREAAKQLGIGINQAYSAARAGTIPSIKIGKRYLVPAAALSKQLGE